MSCFLSLIDVNVDSLVMYIPFKIPTEVMKKVVKGHVMGCFQGKKEQIGMIEREANITAESVK